MINLLRLTKSEFKNQFSSSKIARMLIIILIANISFFFMDPIHANLADPVKETWEKALGQLFTQASMYSLLISIYNVIRDRSTLDRNRVLFLTNSKNKVVSIKVLAYLSIFVITLFTTMFVGSMLIVFKMNGSFSSDFFEKYAIFLCGMIFLYLFVAIGMRWIQAAIEDKIKSAISIIIFLLLTAGAYIIIAGASWMIIDWVKDNKIWIMAIPFLNIITIMQLFYGDLPFWTILPLIAYTIIFISVSWKTFPTKSKQYLCT